jgi:ascorbate-specific PTS system EIIC-type component UlaA
MFLLLLLKMFQAMVIHRMFQQIQRLKCQLILGKVVVQAAAVVVVVVVVQIVARHQEEVAVAAVNRSLGPTSISFLPSFGIAFPTIKSHDMEKI